MEQQVVDCRPLPHRRQRASESIIIRDVEHLQLLEPRRAHRKLARQFIFGQGDDHEARQVAHGARDGGGEAISVKRDNFQAAPDGDH